VNCHNEARRGRLNSCRPAAAIDSANRGVEIARAGTLYVSSSLDPFEQRSIRSGLQPDRAALVGRLQAVASRRSSSTGAVFPRCRRRSARPIVTPPIATVERAVQPQASPRPARVARRPLHRKDPERRLIEVLRPTGGDASLPGLTRCPGRTRHLALAPSRRPGRSALLRRAIMGSVRYAQLIPTPLDSRPAAPQRIPRHERTDYTLIRGWRAGGANRWHGLRPLARSRVLGHLQH